MLKEHEFKAFLAVSEEKQTMKCDWCEALKAAKRPFQVKPLEA